MPTTPKFAAAATTITTTTTSTTTTNTSNNSYSHTASFIVIQTYNAFEMFS